MLALLDALTATVDVVRKPGDRRTEIVAVMVRER